MSDTDRSLHEQYEPEALIHRAVNITRRRLIDRCRTKQHDEYALWVGVDPVTGLETDFWRDDRQKAVEDIAHKVRMGTCHVNECMVFLGEDSEVLYCEDHRPEDYIECAEDGCDLPTSHTLTEFCSTHTWHNGRSQDTGTDRSVELEEGMSPHDLLLVGGAVNICRECGEEFDTWNDANEHQEDEHGDHTGIKIDTSQMEETEIDDTQVFLWEVDYGGHTSKRAVEVATACNWESDGADVRLADTREMVRPGGNSHQVEATETFVAETENISDVNEATKRFNSFLNEVRSSGGSQVRVALVEADSDE